MRGFSRWATSAFFALLLATGALLVRDVGVSWDEPVSRANGGVSLRYVAEHLAPSLVEPMELGQFPPLESYRDRDYGVAFELPAVALERALRLSDSRDVYLLRHALTFLVFVAGVFAVYACAARRFASKGAGLLAAALLVLSPRIFGEGFYNSKDIVFMAAVAIGMATMIPFLVRPTWRAATLHSLACAFAIDVRIMGVVLPAVTLACLAVRIAKGDLRRREASMAALLYVVLLGALVVAWFPWLWTDPLGRFAEAFGNMRRFRWEWEVLYFGEFIPATHLPWHYPLAWIGITTPIPWLLPGCAGVVLTLAQIVRSRLRLWRDDGEMQDAIFLAMFAGPLLAVIALHSVLYDGWRQLYFVYPAFVLLATGALWRLRAALVARPVWQRSLEAAVVAAMVWVTGWMAANHPYEHVYFNALAGSDLRHRFDMDYWGVANRQAVEHLLATDPSPVIQVRGESNTPIRLAGLVLDPKLRDRVRFVQGGERVNPSQPFYRLMNWRLVKFDVDQVLKNNAYRLRPAFEARVGGELFLAVYQDLRPGENDPSVTLAAP